MDKKADWSAPAPVPSMTTEELLWHVHVLDKRAYFKMMEELSPDAASDRLQLLTYLQQHENVLLEVLDDILAAYQTSFHAANEIRTALIRNYQRYSLVCYGLKDEGKEPAEMLESRAKEKRKKAPKKDTEDEIQELENLAKKMRGGDNDLWFAQEKFSEDFPFKEYRHFVKKGHNKWDLTDLQNYGIWSTLYHVTGAWKAELLVAKLEEEEKLAIIIKKLRGSDEIMSYKVISGCEL